MQHLPTSLRPTLRWVTVLASIATVAAASTPPALELTDADEPGEPMVLEVRVTTSEGAPDASLEWTVYQTDHRGYYRQDATGRELGGTQARIKGRVSPDSEGRFRVRTIRPAPYPGGGVPAHVHFRASRPDGSSLTRTLHFTDDPQLSTRARRSAPLCLPERDQEGTWLCEVALVITP